MAASTDLSLEDVARALDSLTIEQTKDLVVHFGVKLNVVTDIIEIQYRNSCPKLHLLQTWLDRDTEASWEKIVGRLKETGMDVLAQRLTTQYCPQLSTDTSSADTTKSATAPPTGGDKPLPVPQGNVRIVKATISRLEEMFSDVMSNTRSSMCQKESQDPNFLDKFRDRLLILPVAQKATHVKFFRESEDDILEAKNIRKIFAILSRYWNYRNYEILQKIITSFCDDSLQTRMQEYCTMLEEFERSTPVDIYLEAISASEPLELALTKMAMKIAKSSSECTLYDIRKLKEKIAEEAFLRSHSVYIHDVDVQCVVVVLSFPPSAVGWVLAAMTPAFMTTHHLTEVTVDGQHLTTIQTERRLLVCVWNYSI